MDYSEILRGQEYAFIGTNLHLGRYVILLGVAESSGSGARQEDGSPAVRGVALSRKSDLIGLTRFEQYEDQGTDTVIYSFNKAVRLLLGANPDALELLGLRPENYLYLGGIGQELIQNAGLFLSKRVTSVYEGYAQIQLRQLQNLLFQVDLPGPGGRTGDCSRLNRCAERLVRVLMTGVDILEPGRVIAGREKEQDLLNGILRGDYQKRDGSFREEFYEIVSEYKRRMEYADAHTFLPEEPDLKRVQDYVMSVNERVVRDEI